MRRRVAQIDRKWRANSLREAPPVAARPKLNPKVIEDVISGEVVKTGFGEHFETERLWHRHRLHGSVEISNLIDLPPDLLHSLSEGAIASSHPQKWAFLDTETTGLSGSTGTYAFLIGVGSIEHAGFRLRQFFMRNAGEEASLLARLAEYLSRFDVLITYNGKTYDQPLLEARFHAMRLPDPFTRLEHLDVLFGARRLWKLRLETCRLIELEYQILGVEREGDLPGEMIPYYYFDYLRTRHALRLVPIFHHNALDILSLACLTSIVPCAFRSPDDSGLRHGADLISLARWLLQSERREEAVRLFRRAVELGLPDHLLFRTLWDIAKAERQLGMTDSAVGILLELAASRNAYRLRACEELAKHYERRERNYITALEMTQRALALADTAALRKREQRLKARLARRRAKLST